MRKSSLGSVYTLYADSFVHLKAVSLHLSVNLNAELEMVPSCFQRISMMIEMKIKILLKEYEGKKLQSQHFNHFNPL